jgi:hypothetical protein
MVGPSLHRNGSVGSNNQTVQQKKQNYFYILGMAEEANFGKIGSKVT